MLNARRIVSHEDIFIQRYSLLLGMALKLTGPDRDQAEDLLHDAFVQFTICRPDLAAIQNLEGYLYGMLRKLHLSNMRRVARRDNRPLSLIDYDSAEMGLRVTDHLGVISARDELRAICNYACARKASSKAGSVLILRFFHGYYPAEIARVLISPRRTVDDFMLVARKEAKLHLTSPKRLDTLKGDLAAEMIRVTLQGQSPTDFLKSLRSAIFSSRQGACLSRADLRDIYLSPDCEAIDGGRLSHLVSCETCLELVNDILGLPGLADRFPTDTLGPDTRSQAGTGAGGGSAGSPTMPIASFHRRLREVYQHTPAEIRVAVNGFIAGSQTVSSEFNEQMLSLKLDEKIGFVEIFSEQDVRLLFLDIEPPPDGAVEQPVRAELSDARTLDLTVSFCDAWPKAHALYCDPSLAPSSDASLAVQQTVESSALERVKTQEKPAEEQIPSRFLSALRSFFAKTLRPGFVTAVFAVLLIVAVLIFRIPGPAVSAAELLRKASESEHALSVSGAVLHRTLSLEERKADGAVVKKKVEIWLDTADGLKARRVFDESGELIEGEFTKGDGSRSISRRGLAPELLPAPQVDRNQSQIDLNNIWLIDLSAADFSTLIGNGAATVEQHPGAYLLNYIAPETILPGPRLVKVTLTLSNPGLHALEQSVVVRDNGGLREYRFAESTFEQVTRGNVPSKVFQPDPSLGISDRAKPAIGRVVDSPGPLPEAAPSTTASLPGLEVEALFQLHRIGACLREQNTQTQLENGRLVIRAVAEGDRRRQEILAALAPVASDPQTTVDVITVAEAVKRQSTVAAGPAISRRIEINSDRVAVYPDLHSYFAKRLQREASSDKPPSEEQVDETVRRFCIRMLTRSRQALAHAWALKRHIDEFAHSELQSLRAGDVARRREIIRDHARAFQQETRDLRLELQPIFFAETSATQEEQETITPGNRAGAVERLYLLASFNERVVRLALALSSDDPNPTIRTLEFLRSLKRADLLAGAIQSWD